MCDAKNSPESDFVSVSAFILFIVCILVITCDSLTGYECLEYLRSHQSQHYTTHILGNAYATVTFLLASSSFLSGS